MGQTSTRSHLRNDLDPKFRISDDEYEQLKSEYEFEKGGEFAQRGSRFAKIAGTAFLIVVCAFIIQQFYFPYGPDLTHILRVIPVAGTILVLIIGFGLFRNIRKQKKHSMNQKKTQQAGVAEDNSDSHAYQYYQKWYRSRDEKMIAGVCGGFAERFGWDPTIVRALFALAFFSYGFSLLIYIVLAIILPKKPAKGMVT